MPKKNRNKNITNLYYQFPKNSLSSDSFESFDSKVEKNNDQIINFKDFDNNNSNKNNNILILPETKKGKKKISQVLETSLTLFNVKYDKSNTDSLIWEMSTFNEKNFSQILENDEMILSDHNKKHFSCVRLYSKFRKK